MEGDKKDRERGGRLKKEGRRKGRGRASQGGESRRGGGREGMHIPGHLKDDIVILHCSSSEMNIGLNRVASWG